MKRTVAALCASSLLIGSAFAADVELAVPRSPRPAFAIPYSAMEWTGLYFGVNAGFGWAQGATDIRFEGIFENGSTTPGGGGATELSGRRVTGEGDFSGLIAGGQVGFNWHSGITVFGFEVDGQWSGRQATFTSACGTGCSASEDVRIRALVTVRGRFGIAYDWIMGYVTGGLAFLNAIDDLSVTIGGVTGNFLPLANTAMGWTFGGGVELAVWEAWSAKLEYLHVRVNDLIADDAIPPILGTGTAFSTADYHDNIVRLGLNYRFGPASRSPVPAPAYLASAPARPGLALMSFASQEVVPERKTGRIEPRQPARRATGAVTAAQTLPTSAGAGVIELPTLPEKRRMQQSGEPKSASHVSPEAADETQKLQRIMQVCRGC